MTLSLFTTEPAAGTHAQTVPLSDKIAMSEALTAAAPFISAIRPFCSQIAVAGSVRRGRTHVGDIEYVAVERRPGAILQELSTVRRERKILPQHFYTKRGAKQVQVQIEISSGLPPFTGESEGGLHRHLQLEFWITSPQQFGWMLFLRTGCHEWNVATMIQLKSSGYEMRDGLIILGNTVIDCSEEKTVFKLLGIPFVEPKFRTGDKALYHELISSGQKPTFKCR